MSFVTRKVFTAVAASSILLAALPLPAGATAASGLFTDDDGHPGEVYLEWLAELGVVQGCNPPANTRICPDRTLNRAEAAKILVGAGQRSGFLPSIPASLPDRFSDDNDLWNGSASRLANFLAYLGVISGCDPPVNRLFCPTQELTRGQVAKMLVGVFDLTAPLSFASPWTDTAGRFYAESARIAAYHGLWDSSLGRFDGGETISRADFARVVVLAATGDDPCPVTPFTAKRVDSLRRRFPGQIFTAYAYDTRTGCAYWMHQENRLRTASVFKVMGMAGTLLEAQQDGRAVSSWESSQLVPMITQSANNPVRALWRHFGGSPWFRRQADIYGLSQTSPVGDTGGVWGRTTTSAKDQADLLRQVLRGEWGPLEEQYRLQAWDLMTSVVSAQTWGVTEGVPSGWTVAQKNGFAGHIANSVGFVRQPGGEDGYVIAVLSNGWSDWHKGVPVVSEISGWVSGRLAS
jgi:hypothetical protein